MSRVELRKKWWIASRPRNVKGAELERALAQLEESGEDKRAAALDALLPAIARTCKELDELVHERLITELGALATLAKAEARKLVAAAKNKAATENAKAKRDAEDPESKEDRLFDPEIHRHTLKRALRQDLVFAFAVGSKAEERVLALAARGNPAAFARLTKARAGGARVCFGRAHAAPGEPATLILILENARTPGTEKAVVAYLREHRISLFRKILVKGQDEEDHNAR